MFLTLKTRKIHLHVNLLCQVGRFEPPIIQNDAFGGNQQRNCFFSYRQKCKNGFLAVLQQELFFKSTKSPLNHSKWASGWAPSTLSAIKKPTKPPKSDHQVGFTINHSKQKAHPSPIIGPPGGLYCLSRAKNGYVA